MADLFTYPKMKKEVITAQKKDAVITSSL